MIGRLPVSLPVASNEWRIRTDYRDILTIMEAYSDPELSDREKAWIMLNILYADWEKMPKELYREAAEKAVWFLDCGQEEDDKKPPRKLMDWEQDEAILFPAINKVAGARFARWSTCTGGPLWVTSWKLKRVHFLWCWEFVRSVQRERIWRNGNRIFIGTIRLCAT